MSGRYDPYAGDVTSRPPRQEQLAGTMFDVPDPPTGPAKTPGGGTWEAYLVWRQSEDGLRVWVYVEAQAMAALEMGATRFSTRTSCAEARDRLKVEINDHYTAWIADDLCRKHIALLDIIERRVRRS